MTKITNQAEAMAALAKWGDRMGVAVYLTDEPDANATGWAAERYADWLVRMTAAVQVDMGETIHEVVLIEAEHLTFAMIERLCGGGE